MIDLNNYLRLEVETAPAGLPNLVLNPSGDKGAWFWVTPVSNTLMETSGTALTFRTVTSQATAPYFTSDYMAVPASKFVSARFDLITRANAGNSFTITYDWYTSAKALISSSAASPQLSAIGTNYSPVAQAPATAAYVKAKVTMYRSAAAPSAGDYVTFNKFMVTYQDTGTVSTTRTNLILNPNFNYVTSGTRTYAWQTTDVDSGQNVSTSAVTGIAGSLGTYVLKALNNTGATTGLRVKPNGAGDLGMHTVSGGKTYTFSVRTRANTAARSTYVEFTWYKNPSPGYYAQVNATATSTKVTNSTTGWTTLTFTATAPSSATLLEINVRIGLVANNEFHYLDGAILEKASTTSYFDGDTTDTASMNYAWVGTAGSSKSTATTLGSTFDFSDPYSWANILGPTHTISVERKALDAGLLVAEILDPNMDPAISADVRVGKRIRLRAVVAGVDESVYEGVLTNAKVSYPREGTRIQISASDNIKTLSQQKEKRGMSFIVNLPYILEGRGVPWNVSGSGNQTTFLNQVSTNDNATLLDQVAILRDSQRGYAWVDRYNVLNVWSRATIPSTVYCTYTDVPNSGDAYDSYTDIDASFSTDDVTNIVTVKTLTDTGINGPNSEEVTWGPFIDQASVDAYGPFARDYTVNVEATATDPGAFAQEFADDVLLNNATPVRKANTMGVVVKDERGVKHATQVDLYTLVHVTYSDKVDSNYRVTSIKHTISPDLWEVDYGFSVDQSVAAPQVTPSPSKVNYQDLTPYVNRYRGATIAIPNNAWTDVPMGTVDASQGITYSSPTFTVTRAGRYIISLSMGWDNLTATGRRQVRLLRNSTAIAQAGIPGSTSANMTVNVTAILNLSIGDTFTPQAFQTSGAALNVLFDRELTFIHATWIGG